MNKSNNKNYKFFPDIKILSESLAQFIASLIREAVSDRGICHMVFAGGSSPYPILENLREMDLPWHALHLYPSDERCVPVGDRDRNDRMIDEIILDHVSAFPTHNLHRIPAELGPEKGASHYQQLLKHIPRFDIALLGVGPDGHTASLFPEHPALNDDRQAVPVYNAPKPPAERVSISLRRLEKTATKIILLIGDQKRHLLEKDKDTSKYPVYLVKPTVWYAMENHSR